MRDRRQRETGQGETENKERRETRRNRARRGRKQRDRRRENTRDKKRQEKKRDRRKGETGSQKRVAAVYLSFKRWVRNPVQWILIFSKGTSTLSLHVQMWRGPLT
jgi:hypothetical protein